MGAIWWGHQGRVPQRFVTGGTQYAMPPQFFLFRFWIWRDFKNKSDAYQVLCEEVFKLDRWPHIPKWMLKQSLVWNH